MAQEGPRSGGVSSQVLELVDGGEEEPAEAARRRRAGCARQEQAPRRRMGRGSAGWLLDVGVAGIQCVQMGSNGQGRTTVVEQ